MTLRKLVSVAAVTGTILAHGTGVSLKKWTLNIDYQPQENFRPAINTVKINGRITLSPNPGAIRQFIDVYFDPTPVVQLEAFGERRFADGKTQAVCFAKTISGSEITTENDTFNGGLGYRWEFALADAVSCPSDMPVMIAADPLELYPNEGYARCTGEFAFGTDTYEVVITISGKLANFTRVLKAGTHAENRAVNFSNIQGTTDAFGHKLFQAPGFSLLIPNDGKPAVYTGVLGKGAWNVQELGTLTFTDCETNSMH